MRVFLDTNVLASALMGRGLCRDLLDRLAIDHEVLLGAPVREELDRVAADKLRVPSPLRAWMNRALDEFTQVAAAPSVPPGIPDPDDAPIIACALTGRADLFVTGDKALLAVKTVRGMPIVSPRECWETLFLPH